MELREDVKAMNVWIAIIENEMNQLKDKTEHTVGSVSFFVTEYDDFSLKISKILNDYCIKTGQISQINSRLYRTETQLDQLEQYGRRENVKIYGIPVMRNESTNQIINHQSTTNEMKLETHILTSHRLFLQNQNQSKTNTNRQPTVL